MKPEIEKLATHRLSRAKDALAYDSDVLAQKSSKTSKPSWNNSAKTQRIRIRREDVKGCRSTETPRWMRLRRIDVQQQNGQNKLAVLIDADNTQPSIVDALLGEIAKYGIASVRRIYGDWTTPNLRGWKDVLLEQAIQPIQQFRYTVGKNATDSALIIDAMDLLYTEKLDGFCIVSSDSDFTRLASRLREGGLTVLRLW